MSYEDWTLVEDEAEQERLRSDMDGNLPVVTELGQIGADGQELLFYKLTELLTENEYGKVIEYHRRTAQRAARTAIAVAAEGSDKFGTVMAVSPEMIDVAAGRFVDHSDDEQQ